LPSPAAPPGEGDGQMNAYQVYVLASQPYVEKIVDDRFFFSWEDAEVYRKTLPQALVRQLHVYPVLLTFDTPAANEQDSQITITAQSREDKLAPLWGKR
jgi:hypothetical protein